MCLNIRDKNMFILSPLTLSDFSWSFTNLLYFFKLLLNFTLLYQKSDSCDTEICWNVSNIRSTSAINYSAFSCWRNLHHIHNIVLFITLMHFQGFDCWQCFNFHIHVYTFTKAIVNFLIPQQIQTVNGIVIWWYIIIRKPWQFLCLC